MTSTRTQFQNANSILNIQNFSKTPFILDKESKEKYTLFEVKGDSMEINGPESIPDGSILLCRNIKSEYWKANLEIDNYDFVIVHETEGVLIGRIKNLDSKNPTFTLHSLSGLSAEKTVDFKEIKQLFAIVEVQSKRKRKQL